MDTLDKQTLEDIIHSLVMRINHVETGTTTHSATDAAEYNKCLNPNDSIDRRMMISIRSISREQRDLITRLEDSIKIFRARLKELEKVPKKKSKH